MNGVTLTLLILGATLPMAALGLGAGLLAERVTGAPGLRERVWGLALLAPVLAIVAVVLVSPHISRPIPPERPVAAAVDALNTGDVAVLKPEAADPLRTIGDLAVLLGPVLLLSVILLGVLVAVGLLVRRHILLGRIVHAARPLEDEALTAELARQAAALKVRPPGLKASDRAGSPLLAGLIRPAIVIPLALTRLPTQRLALICGHELAHLKRGDNPRAWAEGLLLAAMWFNPFMAMIHARLNAAREERCDAMALACADTAARRAYAESLIETLRLSAGPEPQSAFIGAGRKTAMRLKAILKPHDPAGAGAKAGVIAIAAVLVAAVGAGSIALAVQAAPAKGRASTWKQSAQENAWSPKGEILIAADQVETMPGGVTIWRGRPVIELKSATGDPKKDAELAWVKFLVNGHPVADDFTPNALSMDRVALIKVTGPEAPGEGFSTVNFVMLAPEAPTPPPAPPARAPQPPPPPPPTPEVAPTPPTPPVARLAPLAQPAPIAPVAQVPPAPPAPPTPPVAPRPVLGYPVWDARPTGADVAAVYPRAAFKAGLSGRVVLMCKTTSLGLLTECSTRGETPAGNGFAEAALKLAPKFRMHPGHPDGMPIGNRVVSLPMMFTATDVNPTPRPAPNAR